jgi:hypothetical protein
MFVEAEDGFAVLIVLAIDGVARIAVEAGTISSPGKVEVEKVHVSQTGLIKPGRGRPGSPDTEGSRAVLGPVLLHQ